MTSSPRSARSSTGCSCPPGGSYGDQISAAAGVRSPLDHFWSLAIEEQFYWLWPLLLLLAVRLTRRRANGLVVPIVAAAL